MWKYVWKYMALPYPVHIVFLSVFKILYKYSLLQHPFHPHPPNQKKKKKKECMRGVQMFLEKCFYYFNNGLIIFRYSYYL